MDELACDVEVARNFFLVAFKRVSDGKTLTMEMSDRRQLDKRRLAKIMRQNRIITFNGMTYDLAIIYAAISGDTNEQLKEKSDRIIRGGLKWWDIERELDITIPKLDHIDLIEPQPAVNASLKLLAGRLHSRKMQDLPFHPDAELTHEQMDVATKYCCNDLDNTIDLFRAMAEPLKLREALGVEYGMDMRSKSDAQVGEAIIKHRVKEITGNKSKRIDTKAGTTFRYNVPPFISFRTQQMRDVLAMLAATTFVVGDNLKVELPTELTGLKIRIGNSVYRMGLGGLHSSEKNRAVHSDDDYVLIDADVASQYPSIILKLGLYPKSLGPIYLEVGGSLKAERLVAKRAGDKVKAEGGKIALNGGFYGKTGSPYSVLFAPHLMIATTLTGQLSLLMLIERAELAGIPVVSGNTDGVLFNCRRDMVTFDEKGFVAGGTLGDIIKQWEVDTGFEAETIKYKSIYNSSVNSYIAIKEDGKAKRKGPAANPWKENDIRAMLSKNPQMTICGDSVLEYITKGTPIERTIQECTDIRQFVTVINVKGGATWRGDYLGRVARYYWSTDGEPILYAKPNENGTHKKVSNTDGARPLMELPDELPDDIDYAHYIEEGYELARDLAVFDRPPTFKKSDKAALPFLLAALAG
jgi:hypothetical protein